MNAPAHSAQVAKRVLLVGDTEDSLRIEMQTLSALGALFFDHASSIKDVIGKVTNPMAHTALRFDVIVCGETLAGESSYLLLQQLAGNKTTALLPVLFMATTPEGSAMAEENGLVAVCRPYSQASFAESLIRAMSAMRKPLSQKNMDAVCAKLSRHKRVRIAPKRVAAQGVQTTSDVMDEGVNYLRSGDLENAERAFLALTRRSYDNAEAYLGLARVKTQKNEKQAVVGCLIKAAAAFKRQGKFDKARAISKMLPSSSQTEQVFLQEAGVCLRHGEYREAAFSILEHLYEHPEARLHLVVGRLCQLTETPEESLRRLCEVYVQLGYTSISQRLHNQLMAEVTPLKYRKASWLDRYPRLREAIEVASYTTALWRQA